MNGLTVPRGKSKCVLTCIASRNILHARRPAAEVSRLRSPLARRPPPGASSPTLTRVAPGTPTRARRGTCVRAVTGVPSRVAAVCAPSPPPSALAAVRHAPACLSVSLRSDFENGARCTSRPHAICARAVAPLVRKKSQTNRRAHSLKSSSPARKLELQRASRLGARDLRKP